MRTHNTLKSPCPPARSTLSLLPLLLFLLLPGWVMAQGDPINCFTGFNAGDNQTWCAGESAILDGGYQFYDEVGNDPDQGTPTLVWSIVSGSGTFEFDGATGTTVSNINFNNSETGTTGFPDVTFTPDAGVTEVVLRLNGLTSDGPCSGVNEVEEVTLYFDPIQDTPIDAEVDDDDNPPVQVLNDATGTGNTITTQTGSELTLTIDENNVIDNGQQYQDIRRYDVSYSDITGMLGLSGLPAAGQYTQNEFEAAFNAITLENLQCDDFKATLNVFAYYDRNPANVPAPSGECPGPVTSIEITITPRDPATATLGADQLLEVCADDSDFNINITGTANTEITYQIDGVPQSPNLFLDADGLTTIAFDATQYPGAETVNIVLTGASFTEGPPCPATFSKPLQVTIIPLPTLSAELGNPEDAVICNIANGGPNTLPFVLTTNGPPGSYDFTILEMADGQVVESTDLTRVFTDNGDGTASWAGTLDLNGFGGSDVVSNAPLTGGEMTYVVEGESFVPTDDNNPETAECLNDMPDASFTLEIQKESFVVVEINDSEGGTITLSDYSETTDEPSSADVTFCDNETFTLDVVAPVDNNASPTIPGSVALVDVEITDADGVLTAASGIYNFTDNQFDITQALNIPNGQTEDSEFTIVFTPFMDNNGDGQFDGDEIGEEDEDCLGNPLTVNVTVRPAPSVSIEPLNPVCEGETVTLIITASEPGLANLTVGEGGASHEIEIVALDGGGFGNTFTSEPLPAGMNQFTVTTFAGSVADCDATVNEMVMVDVEDNPDATIGIDNDVLCDDGEDGTDATVTFTGSDGSESGYVFTYSIDGGTAITISTDDNGDDDNDTSASITFDDQTTTGTVTVTLISVANLSDLACDTEIGESVTLNIEEVPAVTCEATEGPICSGKDYAFSFTATSNDPSAATGDQLFYSVVVSTTEFNPVSNAFETTDATPVIVPAAEAAPQITGTAVNMSGFNQTITAAATPFYFDTEGGTVEPLAAGDNCTGEEVSCEVVVRTMPMVTLGGESLLCEGVESEVVFTGPPNATFTSEIRTEDGVLVGLGSFQFDGGGTATITIPAFMVEVDIDIIITGLLTVEDCFAQTDFEFDIDVTPTPEGSFDGADEDPICEGSGTTINLTGTPGATITVSADGEINDEDFDVVLDQNGEGSFETGDLSETTTYEIVFVSIASDSPNGEEICFGEVGDEITITVNPAPNGALVSNATLCAGDSPEIQFNLTTAADDLTGTFDIVVNGILFEDVINGEVLDFSGTSFATLEETTDFVLTSITESDEPLACEDVIAGDISVETVTVNAIPEVVVSDVPEFLCSGDDLAITSAGTPGMSEDDDPLFYELILTNGVGEPAGAPVTTLVSAAEVDANSLNEALGLPETFVNGNTDVPDVISFSVQPYYESDPDAPFGTESCGEVMSGFGTNGFSAAEWDTDLTTPGDGATVDFTATEMTLSLIDTDNDGVPGNNGDDNGLTIADARYAIPGTGDLSFDYEYDINEGTFFGLFPADIAIIGFEGLPVFISGPVLDYDGSGTIELSTNPGDLLVVRLRDRLGQNGQVATSTFNISNLEFSPACQPCPGAVTEVEFEILPALFADFDEEPSITVCDDEPITTCITGSPDATVSVFLGGGVFVDVKLDGNGNGCLDLPNGLDANTTLIITGVTTLDADPVECSNIFGADGPTLDIIVIPTPNPTVVVDDPQEVCNGEALSATITGPAGATVTYSITLDGTTTSDLTVDLGLDGEESVALETDNDGDASVAGTITLTSISVPNPDEARDDCVTALNVSDDYTVRPTPNGGLTVGDPVCAGEEVAIFFTPTSELENDYTLVIADPEGVETSYTVTASADSPTEVLLADVAGEYTLISITDGIDQDVQCTNEDPDESVTVVIEVVPDLKAAVSGTVGTANLDNGTIFDAFTAVTCDLGTIEALFTSDESVSSQTGKALMVEVTVIKNDGFMLGLPGASTFVTDLNSLTFAGILENLAAPAQANITVELTPFFEADGDETSLGEGDCAGKELTFNITVLPAVELAFDATSTTVVCENGDVTISLTGSPGGVVSFSTDNLLGVADSDDLGADTDGQVTLDTDGNATITATAGSDGTEDDDASISLDMIVVTTTVGNQTRQCMMMEIDELDIEINEVPEAMISVEPAGPICINSTVDVIGMLVTTGYDEGDMFTFTVNGEQISAAVDADGKAVLIDDISLSEDTEFTLEAISNDATLCGQNVDADPVLVEVELLPNGDVLATGDAEGSTASGPLELTICANESINLVAVVDEEAPKNDDAETWVSVDYDSPLDFYGLGAGSGTIAMPFEDFADQFSATYTMISGAPVVVTLEVTYYIENNPPTDEDGGAPGLDDDDCSGTIDNIIITINPNPKTVDVDVEICSRESVDYELDNAITNGVENATFTYTVSSDDVDVSGRDRTVASGDLIDDEFENFSSEPFTVLYTVTPFGAEGCQGNDFELEVVINPEPVITAGQTTMVCSGEETGAIIRTDNFDDGDITIGEPLSDVEFTLENIEYSVPVGENFGPVLNEDGLSENAMIGDEGDWLLIADDAFFNTTSGEVTVTYTLSPTSSEEDGECAGDEEVIVVTIKPEPVVADMVMKVCSGSAIDLGFNELTANGVGDILSFSRSMLPLTALRVFDEDRDDITLDILLGNSTGSTAIQDSFLNQGTATLSVFYDIAIEVQNGEGVCEAATFQLEVRVLEETNAILEPIAGQTAICEGEPIVLVTNYDGSGSVTDFHYTYTSEDGVELMLVESAAGGEVEVIATSGSGNAVVMVMVTDDNGCVAMGTRTVSVGESPEELEIAGFEDPCTGDPNFYSIESTEGSTYAWALSDPAVGSFTNGTQTGDNVSITFNDSQGPGPFTLSVTETNNAGCSTVSSLELTIVTGTTAAFSAEQDEEDGLTFQFTELASGGVEAYIWDFGDGVGTSTEQNPSYTYAPGNPDEMVTYTVTLTVLGCSGPALSTMDITVNSNTETDVIELKEGINFISFDVAPADNRLDAIFSGVSGLRRVTTVDDGAATFYQPGAGPFNSLQTAEPGFGYVVIMNNDATLTVTGEPIDDAFIRPMGMGINYIAFVPDGQMVAADFWAPFEATDEFVLARTFGNNVTPNVQSYFPGFGPFNSMQHTFNGVGYLVLQQDAEAGLDEAELESSSENYEFLYGTVSGTDYRTGEPIEILDTDGNVIGSLNPDRSGIFRATPLYGKVETENGLTMGAWEEGETVSFRYNGQVITPGVSFQGQFAGTELNLDFSNAPSADKMTLSVQPNPAAERTSLVLQLTTSTDLSVEAVDATGRIVRTLLPRQQLAAGTTTIEWDDLGQLPAGMYHILVTRDGRIDTALTQRLVKR